jgi:hypothetical protein
MSIFEQVEGKWNIKQGVFNENGEQVTLKDMLIVKRLIDRGRYQTMGHSKFKGNWFNNSYVRSLFFFVNYMVPLFQGLFVSSRKDFVGNMVVENYTISLLKYFTKMIQYGTKGMWYWNYMTNAQKVNVGRGMSAYITLFALTYIMKYLFGFDPSDEDAYKKLKENNQFSNFLLATTLKAASEIEQGSLLNPLSKTYLPAITANYESLTNPTLLRLIKDLGKESQRVLEYGEYMTGLGDADYDDVYYKKDMKRFGIKKGESKFVHNAKKYLPINPMTYDFIGQVRVSQEIGNK